jgi:hypothetical protein
MNPVTKSGIFYGMIEPGRWFVEVVHGRRRLSYTERSSARAAVGVARQMQRTYTRLPVRAASNPLTRKESASLLRSARQSAARAPHWHDPKHQHAEWGYAGGLVEAVRRCGPRGAKRASQVLFGRAKGWSKGEYRKHFGLNPSRLYKARWGQTGAPDIANVSFEARSDYEAKLRADKIARELGVTHTPRTIQRSGGGMVECRMSGTSSNPRSCKMCGGPLVKMGGLGNLMWYRCRNCGMETSVKK